MEIGQEARGAVGEGRVHGFRNESGMLIVICGWRGVRDHGQGLKGSGGGSVGGPALVGWVLYGCAITS